jgi:hypothetical protein
MPKYSESVLRIICLALAGLLLLQLASLAMRRNPLAGIRLPTVVSSIKAAAPERVPTGTNTPPVTGASLGQTNLPPDVQARIDRITDSEILGPVPRPMVMPVALLGIAGKDAFLRTPSGQTGLLRVGEELGGIKLLQIGTNRVLVEQDGQKKELTLFSGFGSQPLLPKGKENPQ